MAGETMNIDQAINFLTVGILTDSRVNDDFKKVHIHSMFLISALYEAGVIGPKVVIDIALKIESGMGGDIHYSIPHMIRNMMQNAHCTSTSQLIEILVDKPGEQS